MQIDYKNSKNTKKSVKSVFMGLRPLFEAKKHFQNLSKDRKAGPQGKKAGPQFERVTYVTFLK